MGGRRRRRKEEAMRRDALYSVKFLTWWAWLCQICIFSGRLMRGKRIWRSLREGGPERRSSLCQ